MLAHLKNLANDKQKQALLRQYVHRDHLLGPTNATEIKDFEAKNFLFSYQENVYKKENTHPAHIVGRRGSGKTAYLSHTEIQDNYNIIINFDKTSALREIIYKIKAVSPSIVFVEEIANYWDVILYSAILHELKKKYSREIHSDKWLQQYWDSLAIRPVKAFRTFLNKLLNRMAAAHNHDEYTFLHGLFGSAAELVEDPVDTLKIKVNAICKKNHIKVVILIDSLEEYRLDIEDSDLVMQGFLKATGRFNVRRNEPEVRCCIPSELYYLLVSMSSNTAKDFPKPLVLHWAAHDLCSVALNRIQIHQCLYGDGDDAIGRSILECDLNDRESVFTALRLIFYGETCNEYGSVENPLLFMLRHTQLLPRQILDVFHTVLKENSIRGTGIFNYCSPEIVRDGVRAHRSNMAKTVCNAYKYQHPHAYKMIRETLSRVGRKETYNLTDIEKVFSRHIKRRGFVGGTDMEEAEYIRMLSEVGCIGVVTSKTEKYIKGSFEFNSRSEIEFDSSSEIVFHPLFRGAWEERCVDNPFRVVMPYGIDPMEAP